MMKKNSCSINLIGCFFSFFLLAFFSFQSNAYPAPSFYFDTVQKIYIGYYQRPADPGGLIYWAGRLDSAGGSFAEIIEAYANSAESQALYGTINSSNISTVVNGIYYALFGRDAEAGGLNYYVTGFNSGQFTPATIMLNVLYGAQNEDLQSVNNKLVAANLFTRTIDPEPDGSNFQVTYAGNPDAIAGRNFLALYATSVKVPTQAETTAYIQANIADPGDPITTAPSTTQTIAGIWIGAFSSNVTHNTFDVLGVVTEQGMARFTSISLNTQYSAAVLNVSGNNFSTTATAYGSSDSYIGMADIVGTFTPKGIINGTYNGVGDAGTLSLAYSSLYERPSSLAAIAGSWTNYSSGYYETVTIDSSGNVTRPTVSGCSTSGSISVIDSRYNVYQVNLTVNNCGSQNGLYEGLAVLTDTRASNDTLVGSATTSTYSFIADLRRN